MNLINIIYLYKLHNDSIEVSGDVQWTLFIDINQLNYISPIALYIEELAHWICPIIFSDFTHFFQIFHQQIKLMLYSSGCFCIDKEDLFWQIFVFIIYCDAIFTVFNFKKKFLRFFFELLGIYLACRLHPVSSDDISH